MLDITHTILFYGAILLLACWFLVYVVGNLLISSHVIGIFRKYSAKKATLGELRDYWRTMGMFGELAEDMPDCASGLEQTLSVDDEDGTLDAYAPPTDAKRGSLFRQCQTFARENDFFYIGCYRDSYAYTVLWLKPEESTALLYQCGDSGIVGFHFSTETDDTAKMEYDSACIGTIFPLPPPPRVIAQDFASGKFSPEELWLVHQNEKERLKRSYGFQFPPYTTWGFAQYMPGGDEEVLRAYHERNREKILDAFLMSLPNNVERIEKGIRSYAFWRFRIQQWTMTLQKKCGDRLVTDLIDTDDLHPKLTLWAVFNQLLVPALLVWYLLRSFHGF